VIWGGAVFWGSVSAVGTAVAADAPPATDKDTPTTPTIGTATLRAFRFEAGFLCGIVESSRIFEQMFDEVGRTRTPGLFVRFAQTPRKADAAARGRGGSSFQGNQAVRHRR